MRRAIYPFIGLLVVTSFLLGMMVSGARGGNANAFPPVPLKDAPPVVVTAGSTPAAVAPMATSVDFAPIAAYLNTAIVNVDTAVRAEPSADTPRSWRRGGDEAGPREGSGSGFVIDPAGYILTNHHVIDGADRVTVTLSDGRALRATVVGADPAIDVALLHVVSDTPLTSVPIGQSGALRVGEWVCAIGNPLGYVHSVTVGVVSFLGRKLFDQSLDEYIQTDAAISFGNSGGPLINARGEVVGITTAISVQASNIGFAVPIDQVMCVLPQLRAAWLRRGSCLCEPRVHRRRPHQRDQTVGAGARSREEPRRDRRGRLHRVSGRARGTSSVRCRRRPRWPGGAV